MGLGQRAAEHGEVLGEGKHGAAVHGAPAGDDAVAGNFRLVHAEISGAVLDEHVEFFERAPVHQELEPLPCGQLAALVLGLDARKATADPRAGATAFELFPDVFHVVRSARPVRDSMALRRAEPRREVLRLNLWLDYAAAGASAAKRWLSFHATMAKASTRRP